MRLLNSNKFYLNTPQAPKRFLHIATIEDGVHEYLCYTDKSLGTVHIEEITGGSMQPIKDDVAFDYLENFLHEHKLLDMCSPLEANKSN